MEQPIDIYSYICGICIALYLFTCLFAGLRMRFNLFNSIPNYTPLIREVGRIFLIFTCGVTCYIISNIFPGHDWLATVGNIIDISAFMIIIFIPYAVYYGKQPPKRHIWLPIAFFAVMMVLTAIFPKSYYPFFVAFLATYITTLVFAIRVSYRRRWLEDIYSNPESHTLNWIWGVVLFYTGWIILGLFFHFNSFDRYYDIAMFLYMTGFIHFIILKICSYRKPVSEETQKQVEQEAWSYVPVQPTVSHPLQQSLTQLLEKEQIYLNPDLTVEIVATRLNTNAHFLSAVLHNDMNTSFSSLINRYRVEHAKNMLATTDMKIDYIGSVCGFNSQQVFYRTFSRFTGKTPAEWRKSN